ncbi:MAG: (2Fe-2S)-binding protein [Dehalococcoidia bacterium]|nr:(2Fe-2S)-binding protein [Dehalococcoidia bacterium]
MVTLEIDGQKVEVEEGTTVLQAARKLGIEIPTLCYNEAIQPYGACRLCVVEVIMGNVSRFQSSCSLPVADGMTVKTNSESVLRGRKVLLELYLARCPQSKEVKELCERYGVTETRFKTFDKMEDCVLCGLCVRVCDEVVGAHAIDFVGRGTERRVDVPFERLWDKCLACGACTYVCPTGHIQNEGRRIGQLRRNLGTERKCRYMLMGAVSSKICPNNYECWRCEYDQRTEYQLGNHPALALKTTGKK